MKTKKEDAKFKNKLTLHQYMHAQFIRIGFVFSGVMGLMDLIAILEGVRLVQQDTRFALPTGAKIGIVVGGILAITIISILAIDFLLNRIANQVIRRVKEPVDIMDDAMDQLAKGNLDVQVEYERQDEFFNMMNNANFAMKELKRYVDDISLNLNHISEKDIDLKEVQQYIGDFSAIEESMTEILGSLNTTLGDMKESFGAVCNGADTLAQSAQSMAEGAQQQSDHVRSLVDNIENVSDSVHKSTGMADKVEKLSRDAVQQMQEGEEKMNELVKAMDLIREESNEIANIIQVIGGIAEQTNLLALNASIEAARAGEHGKGFAVVAGEIGTLAGSSAEAAQNITDLIHKSIAAVNNGVAITDETVHRMGGIGKISEDISAHVSQITETMKKQDSYLQEMISSAEEISAVVDENTASAQESSALSQELFSEMENAMKLIDQYKLRS